MEPEDRVSQSQRRLYQEEGTEFASERNSAAASVSLFSSVAPKLDRIEPQQCLLVFFFMTQRRFKVTEQSFLHQPTSPNPPDDLQQVSVWGQLNLSLVLALSSFQGTTNERHQVGFGADVP